MNAETEQVELSKNIRKEVDAWIKKFPEDQKQSAVLTALRLAQEENGGSLTLPLMNAVADYLDMPQIAVYEVATFYSMYELKPIGRHKISVCTNVSCMLCGSEKIVEHLENRLGAKMGETTEDGAFTLREVECLAACANAPMMMVDDKKYHLDLTEEKVDAVLDKIIKEDAKRGG